MIDMVFSGLFGTAVGLYLGNRMALWREKRKEFNQATEEIRSKLYTNIANLEAGKVHGRVTSKEISEVVTKLGEKRANKIISSFNRYDATYNKCVFNDGYGQLLSRTPGCSQELSSDARRLYKLTQPI